MPDVDYLSTAVALLASKRGHATVWRAALSSLGYPPTWITDDDVSEYRKLDLSLLKEIVL